MNKLVIAGLLLAVGTAHAHDLTDKQANDLAKWAADKRLSIYVQACKKGDPDACTNVEYILFMRDYAKKEAARRAEPEPASRSEVRVEPRAEPTAR